MGIVKAVSFKKKETDMLEFLEDKDFTYYVKELIKKDMQNVNPNVIKTEEPKKKRNTNFAFED